MENNKFVIFYLRFSIFYFLRTFAALVFAARR